MAKIMVVEDDQSLREIYSIRLTAEGYEVVSAGDGEEALAIAVKERPDLVLSDVMMPKISGFDMLDILRSTPETKNIKVIMMTALSSDDQRKRGESLGADKYLVKSQVGIEDVIAAVREVLGGVPGAPVAQTPTPVAQPTPQPMPPVQPVSPQPIQPVTQPVSAPAPAPAQATVQAPVQTPLQAPAQAPTPQMPVMPQGSANVQPPMPQQPTTPVAPAAPAQ